MDFAWSEEQLEYKNAAIRFAQKELSTGIVAHDRHETFPQERWHKCADFGVLGLPFPESYGGAEADILTTMLVMEGLWWQGQRPALCAQRTDVGGAASHP